MVHMSFCSALGFLLICGLRVIDPPTSPPMIRDLYVTFVIPISTFSLWCCCPHLTLSWTRSGTRHHDGAVGDGKSIERTRRDSWAMIRKSDENIGRKRKRKMSGGGGEEEAEGCKEEDEEEEEEGEGDCFFESLDRVQSSVSFTMDIPSSNDEDEEDDVRISSASAIALPYDFRCISFATQEEVSCDMDDDRGGGQNFDYNI